jgi:hypothetical protein
VKVKDGSQVVETDFGGLDLSNSVFIAAQGFYFLFFLRNEF